jgi:NADPH-dependent 2,4-dienoyl-CoA reductase/sulfur reductase-like enzyme/rhodanese-related sulfurtransferase
MAKYLVVGGVAAGAAFAAKLRRIDESAEITVFERGPYVSYANCGLPYHIGGTIPDAAELLLHTPESLRGRFNIRVLTGREVIAINKENKSVQVKNLADGQIENYEYDKLLLATGARPVRLPLAGAELPGVFTLRDVDDTLSIKRFIAKDTVKRAAVVGGGFIGLEMAENFRAAGLDVTLIEDRPQVLPSLDRETAAIIHNHLREKGVELWLNTRLTRIDKAGDNLLLATSRGETIVQAALLSAGVRPETELAAAAGLELGETGGIKVNEYMQTSDENIYAAGDAAQACHLVTGRPILLFLAGKANKEARAAARHMTGQGRPLGRALPVSVLKVFELTAAGVGANERELREAGLNYDKIYLHPPSHAGYYPGGGSLHMKVLFATPGGQLLGAQLIGSEGADKRADVLATALKAGMTVYELSELELAYAPPYSSTRDPVNYAGAVAAELLNGSFAQDFWHERPDLARGEGYLLDVRTKEEFRQGSVPGAANIPLHELRAEAARLPRDRTVYVFCQTGARSYTACRLLRQTGLTAVNMSGGYVSWRILMEDAGQEGI